MIENYYFFCMGGQSWRACIYFSFTQLEANNSYDWIISYTLMEENTWKLIQKSLRDHHRWVTRNEWTDERSCGHLIQHHLFSLKGPKYYLFLKISFNSMAIYRKSLPLYKEVPDHLVRVPGTPGRGKCCSQGMQIGDRWWIVAFQHITVTWCTVWVYFQSPYTRAYCL